MQQDSSQPPSSVHLGSQVPALQKADILEQRYGLLLKVGRALDRGLEIMSAWLKSPTDAIHAPEEDALLH
jgi:hypothetical protein